MIEKIIKTNIRLSISYCEVAEQPVVHAGLKGKMDIFLNDGTVIKDVGIDWDDIPSICDSRISREEGVKIMRRMEDNLFDLAGEITHEMCRIKSSRTLEKDFWDKFWVDNAMGK